MDAGDAMTAGGAVHRVVIAFSGSRIYSPKRAAAVREVLKELYLQHWMSLVIHVGDCPSGVDAVVASECIKQNIAYHRFVADWRKHGPSAGPKRNAEMLKDCSELHAFPCAPEEGESRGTRDAIEQATKRRLRVVVHEVKP